MKQLTEISQQMGSYPDSSWPSTSWVMQKMSKVCPERVFRHVNDCMSHIRMVWSLDPLARRPSCSTTSE